MKLSVPTSPFANLLLFVIEPPWRPCVPIAPVSLPWITSPFITWELPSTCVPLLEWSVAACLISMSYCQANQKVSRIMVVPRFFGCSTLVEFMFGDERWLLTVELVRFQLTARHKHTADSAKSIFPATIWWWVVDEERWSSSESCRFLLVILGARVPVNRVDWDVSCCRKWEGTERSLLYGGLQPRVNTR